MLWSANIKASTFQFTAFNYTPIRRDAILRQLFISELKFWNFHCRDESIKTESNDCYIIKISSMFNKIKMNFTEGSVDKKRVKWAHDMIRLNFGIFPLTRYFGYFMIPILKMHRNWYFKYLNSWTSTGSITVTPDSNYRFRFGNWFLFRKGIFFVKISL